MQITKTSEYNNLSRILRPKRSKTLHSYGRKYKDNYATYFRLKQEVEMAYIIIKVVKNDFYSAIKLYEDVCNKYGRPGSIRMWKRTVTKMAESRLILASKGSGIRRNPEHTTISLFQLFECFNINSIENTGNKLVDNFNKLLYNKLEEMVWSNRGVL